MGKEGDWEMAVGGEGGTPSIISVARSEVILGPLTQSQTFCMSHTIRHYVALNPRGVLSCLSLRTGRKRKVGSSDSQGSERHRHKKKHKREL